MLVNGFKTKQQEEEYHKSLYGIIFLMQYTISKLITPANSPDVILKD